VDGQFRSKTAARHKTLIAFLSPTRSSHKELFALHLHSIGNVRDERERMARDSDLPLFRADSALRGAS
jgi:hypothetical protein